ncbi:AAA family ATPase [Noviherbaspirillum sp. 1P10PC]|uniref:AAA family ATPase n=1 Tax=Noviherbaspirillum sp. 1P10PC TaxID=3132292 RepID=UPI0039A23B58
MTGFKLGIEADESKAARVMLERAAAASLRTVNLRCAADITAKPITWLWKNWIPAGKLTILAGNGGTGKTTLALGLAAILTAWGKWPDGAACAEAGNVLIWSSEDNPDDTLVPRLIASGANMKRCHFIDGITENGERLPFDPAQDIPELHRAVEGIGGVALLIVDPIVSAVSGDMHKANDVRRSLQALVDFGEAHKCAVLGITHFSKGGVGKSPMDRVIGSQAFGALARMVLVTAKEEDSTRRVLARAKSNIAPDDGGVSYNVELTALPSGIEATHVIWEGPIEGTAREILGEVEHDEHGDSDTQTDLGNMLMDTLTHHGGKMTTKQLMSEVRDAGHSWDAAKRLKKSLGIVSEKDGMTGPWVWRIYGADPRRAHEGSEERTEKTLLPSLSSAHSSAKVQL